jgi:hypothetical protein
MDLLQWFYKLSDLTIMTLFCAVENSGDATNPSLVGC